MGNVARLTILLGVSGLLLAACGPSTQTKVEEPPPPPPEVIVDYSAEALWALAPEGAVAGMVIPAGTLVTLSNVVLHAADIAANIPRGPELFATLEQAAGINVGMFRPDFWTTSGLDMRGGLAVFVTDAGAVVAALPVNNREAFRTLVFTQGGGVATEQPPVATTEADVDHFGGNECRVIEDRYICRSGPFEWATLGKGTALGQKVAALTPTLRGDIEFYGAADLSPKVVEMATLVGATLKGDEWVAAAVDMAGGKATFNMKVSAALPRTVTRGFDRQFNGALLTIHEPATGVFRAQMPKRWVREMPSYKVGPIDVMELLFGGFTGDLVVMSSAEHPMALVTGMGMSSTTTLSGSLPTLCTVANLSGFGSFSSSGRRCTGKLGISKFIPREFRKLLPGKAKVTLDARPRSAVIGFLTEPKTGAPGELAGSKEAKDIVQGDWSLAMWGRWSDVFVDFPSWYTTLVEPLTPDERAQVTAARLLADHIYDSALGIKIESTGIRVLGAINTMAADEPAIYKTYTDAVVQLGRGDVTTYKQVLAGLAKSHPQSLAGRQSGARATMAAVFVGAAMVWSATLPAMSKYLRRLQYRF